MAQMVAGWHSFSLKKTPDAEGWRERPLRKLSHPTTSQIEAHYKDCTELGLLTGTRAEIFTFVSAQVPGALRWEKR